MIYLNGQENYEIKIPIKITTLVENLGLQNRTIAIAHNGEVITKKIGILLLSKRMILLKLLELLVVAKNISLQ